MNKQKFFQIIAGIAVVLFLVWLIKYAYDTNRQTLSSSLEEKTQEEVILNLYTLSNNQKEIMSGDSVYLSIDNEQIFEFFKNSDLCDEFNMMGVFGRESFCMSVESFREQTSFKNVFSSLKNDVVGFTIESDTLAPDTVVGVYTQEGGVKMLTNYYLGNEFLGFSADGKYFVYRGSCFEAKCGLYVYDANTLEIIEKINDTEYLDARMQNASFISWEGQSTLKYKIGEEEKEISFE